MEDGMFEKISLEEALKTINEFNTKTEELREQGAQLNGEREIDQKFTGLIEESVKYTMQ